MFKLEFFEFRISSFEFKLFPYSFNPVMEMP